MRLATVNYRGARRWGVVTGDRIRLAPADDRSAPTLRDFIEQEIGYPQDVSHWETVGLDQVTLDAPLPDPPRNVICLGMNYADHAAESQGLAPGRAQLPEYPVFFTKATTAVSGPAADIVLDERATRRLDWEVELAFVIGRRGRHIDVADAMDHVFGYTVINDLSARDRQKNHQQFFLGKSMDGSAPMGPWIVTADDVPDPQALAIRSSVNGTVKQQSRTDQLIFGVARIIECLSAVMTLMPGDIVATGTPGGVGFARTPPEFLQVGDVVECDIESIGNIRNRIIAPG